MLRYIGRRLLVAIPTLLLVITAAFFMMRAAPGSPFDMDRKLLPEIEANVLAKYGMNKPLPAQYADYLLSVARGDLGPSLKYRDKSVLDILKENYPISLKLGLSAILIAAVVGVSLGVMAALEAVSAVTWFDDDTPEALIGTCQPDVLVKGGDWPVERIAGAKGVLARGGSVVSIPFEHERSTTALVQRIRGSI